MSFGSFLKKAVRIASRAIDKVAGVGGAVVEVFGIKKKTAAAKVVEGAKKAKRVKDAIENDREKLDQGRA